MSLRTIAPRLLANAFVTSGTVHLVRPQLFEPIMPRAIPRQWHRPLIYVSGLVELICAYGLFRRTRWASSLSVATLAAVFPANVQMALDSGKGKNPSVTDHPAVAWGRLPLQAAFIWAARQARSAT